MNSIIKLNNVFAFEYIDFDNTIVNYCIDFKVDNCKKLDNTHEYVKLAKNNSVGSTFEISNVHVKLIYKGLDIDKNVIESKYSEKYSNKIVKEVYLEDEPTLSSSEVTTNKIKLIKNLKQYNELGFVHETAISNIKSIYNMGGIYSRNFIKKSDIINKDIAEHNVLAITPDNFKDKARFYLRTKTPAHYKFKADKGSTCLFICDYNIVFNKISGIYMTDRIATKRIMQNDLNNCTNIMWLNDNLKYDYIFNPYYVEDDLKDYKGAEFLVANKVDLKYLKAIIFADRNQCESFIKEYPDWKIDVICDSNSF